jgi:hypothetical protein
MDISATMYSFAFFAKGIIIKRYTISKNYNKKPL